MQALKGVMQNPNEVPEPRQRGRLGRMNPDDPCLEWFICHILKSRKRRLVRIGLSRPVHTTTGSAATPCMIWGGKEGEIYPRDRAVGVLERTGNPLCFPSLHTACTEPREKKNLLLMLLRVCFPLWKSDGGSFL